MTIINFDDLDLGMSGYMFPENNYNRGRARELAKTFFCAKHFPEKVASREHITLRGNIYH